MCARRIPEELRQWFGADAGSLGPIGVKKVRILADEALRGRRNMIAGANKNDYHLRNVTPGEDFEAEFHDLRQAAEGDTSVVDGSPLTVHKTVEIGHIFKLGYKYSKSMGLHVTNESGEEIAPIMGSYGIGIERILSAAVELYHDADGIALPAAIAPFTVVVTPVNGKDDAQRQAAAEIYAALKSWARRTARRSRRAPGREIQGRRPDRHSLPDHGREEAARRDRGTGGAQAETFDRRAHRQGCGRSAGIMDWINIRKEFPALERWTYLNTATYGQMPRRAVEAMTRHSEQRDELASTNFLDWYTDADRMRASIARLIHAEPDDIAFVPNAAAALSIVLAGSRRSRARTSSRSTTSFPTICIRTRRARSRGSASTNPSTIALAWWLSAK